MEQNTEKDQRKKSAQQSFEDLLKDYPDVIEQGKNTASVKSESGSIGTEP